jgi:hypothetical protein
MTSQVSLLRLLVEHLLPHQKVYLIHVVPMLPILSTLVNDNARLIYHKRETSAKPARRRKEMVFCVFVVLN